MRITIKMIVGAALWFSAYGLSFATTLSTTPEQNLSPTTEKPTPTARCADWKQICYQKTYCTFRQGLREGCYRCLNYNRVGAHLYPREMERTSCNPDTVDYLRTMGFRCYQPYEHSPCLRTVQKEVCDWTCANS